MILMVLVMKSLTSLNRTFYGIEINWQEATRGCFKVLIVPFMELKYRRQRRGQNPPMS